MTLYPVKTFYRNFMKQKLIYSITIVGFAISLAVLILIVSYILEEKSVDKHLPHIANMYRIKQSNGDASIPQRIYQPILDAAPEIDKLCLINSNGVLYEYDNEKKYAKAVTTNKEFIDVFSIVIIQGERKGLLESKTDVLITESFAKKVFGNKNPLGEVLVFGDKEKKVVQAIIADPIATSSLKYDVIINLKQELFYSSRGYNSETYTMFDAIFVLNPLLPPSNTQKKIAELLKPYEGYKETLLAVQPFSEVYFDLKSDNDQFSHANLGMIKLLSWIAIIILILAMLNYINLTTALNNERHKEICIRKTSGAGRGTIFWIFLQESYLSCFISLLLGIGLAILISPFFKELFNKEMNIIDALRTPQTLLSIIFIFIFVGSITGIIPAIVVSKFTPIDLLQQKVRLRNSNIRGIYNTIQLAVTLCLIIGLFVIVKQIKYVKTKDVGFNKELLVSVRLQAKTSEKAAIIKENLLKNPSILNVSGTHGRPFGIYSTSSGSWQNDSIEYNIEKLALMNTDTSFLSTFGLKLIRGRNFRPTDNDGCIINEKTYNYLQLNDLDGKSIMGSELIGVVKDFHFKKMYSELGFISLRYNPEQISHLNIRLSGNNIPESLAQIKSIFKEFEPGINFEPEFYDNWINNMYQKEEKQAKAVKIYALIALLLSCMGLLGLSKFIAIKRTKEIGIRKVNGARIAEIMALLNKDFIKWVAIAFVIATPIAWYAMHKWLENFAYKTELSWWIFALAG
ncbi:MAG: ABC transporter permease, partial [Prolixibacteraceae bacterium]|nr:ABC transporter permease [Prolixibacteraceae bacterium]